VKQFPSVVIAGMFGFKEEEFFEVEDAIREGGAPQVDFGEPTGSGAPLAGGVAGPPSTGSTPLPPAADVPEPPDQPTPPNPTA
jgi:hypothetical protein